FFDMHFRRAKTHALSRTRARRDDGRRKGRPDCGVIRTLFEPMFRHPKSIFRGGRLARRLKMPA
ncbi:MAG TPA: hypothetical protein VMR25_07040, partial [Planctomycetaceae bacterium]|nr:hypothetical protein [Planctomycetaceae bacterium]